MRCLQRNAKDTNVDHRGVIVAEIYTVSLHVDSLKVPAAIQLHECISKNKDAVIVVLWSAWQQGKGAVTQSTRTKGS